MDMVYHQRYGPLKKSDYKELWESILNEEYMKVSSFLFDRVLSFDCFYYILERTVTRQDEEFVKLVLRKAIVFRKESSSMTLTFVSSAFFDYLLCLLNSPREDLIDVFELLFLPLNRISDLEFLTGSEILFYAMKKNSRNIMKRVIKENSDIFDILFFSSTNYYGPYCDNQSRHAVDIQGELSFVRTLLELYRDEIDIRNNKGETILLVACEDDDDYSVKLLAELLKYGADVNATNSMDCVAYKTLITRNSRQQDYELFKKWTKKYKNTLDTTVLSNKFLISKVKIGAQSDWPDLRTKKRCLLKLHIYKLKTAGFQLNKQNEEEYERNKEIFQRLDIESLCKKELEMMKTKIIHGAFTLDRVFKQRHNPTYVSNEEVMVALERVNLKREFPLYAEIIKDAVYKGKKRAYFLDIVQRILCHVIQDSCSNKFQMPAEIGLYIVSMLDDQQLMEFLGLI